MSDRGLLDTNVLVYADDSGLPQKRDSAIELVERLKRDDNAVISTQVLVEYFAVVTRKLGVDVDLARRKVELLSRLPLVVLTPNDILAAINLSKQHTLAIWDAMIVQAALVAKCDVIYSEDMQHDRRFGPARIVNPFLAT